MRPSAEPAAAADPATASAAERTPATPEDVDGSGRRTSELLEALIDPALGDSVSVAEIVQGLRNRAFGLLLILFAIPATLPSPPPIPTICILVMMLVALNMIVGRSAVWLPGFIGRRAMSRALLAKVVRRALPLTMRLERICRPRLLWITRTNGKAMFGSIVVLLCFVLMLPIPFFGNFTPGLSIGVIGLGLSERDGLVMLLGLVLSAVAVAVTLAIGWATILAVMAVF